MLRKSVFNRIFAMLTVLVIFTMVFSHQPINASASTNLNITCYPISGSIPVYTKFDQNTYRPSDQKGTIYYSDTVTILKTSGPTAYVRYPVTGTNKTKEGWIRTSYVLMPTTVSSRSASWGAYISQHLGYKKATSTIYTYRHPNSNNRCGSIYAKDGVWIYSSSNGFTQVRYPISNGYKIALIKNSDLKKLN